MDREIQKTPWADEKPEGEAGEAQCGGTLTHHRGTLAVSLCAFPLPALPHPGWEGLTAYRLCVQDYAEFHTELTVCFVVRLTDASAKWGDKEIEDGWPEWLGPP